MNSIGDTIRNTRKKQKLTLKEVSTMASISLSFLSEIERDKVNPSLSVLKRIANALGVNFTDLFGEEKRSIVIRKNERKPLVHSEGSRITWYALSHGSGNKMGPIWGVLEKGATSGDVGVGHPEGEEFLFIHTGRLEFILGNERFTLEEGDSIYYDARTPHSYKNIAEGETLLIAVPSPATF
ncbi:helix-turn-helix domain-containing protein [Paenibacillus cellulositrophicus]|uniref:Transcriptional regulator with XRE-family HTH domain n=2 Tax=Paenibacillus TaxID=44249 RepID=A0ABV2FC40_9BACL|nr:MULTISPECIES: helix-turn-helix domain-containing protein [Paenibacillus]MCM2996101.1 helix-turn-helix domain-containing protein [Paenibacillus cellulositrophicus]